MDNKLSGDFYYNPNVTQVARQLLGKILWSKMGKTLTAGKIVETEAYCGATDKACHAFPDKRTPRTEIMYHRGGVAYVYLVYGMHHLFNIVTNTQNNADAVLIRAIEPIHGLEVMKIRRGIVNNNKTLTGGPARLTQALGISVSDNKTNLSGDKIWVTEGEPIVDKMIVTTPRIGVDYAGEDAHLPWRFYIKDNIYVSK